MERVVLGLGSNVGSRLGYIKKALKEISLIEGINILALSSVYETEPWGLKEQRSFLNSLILCLCKLNVTDLYGNLKKIEKKLGRKARRKWAPREIDIDILFYGNHIIKKKTLKVPHPMIGERNFVLVPLNELIPGFKHPVSGKKISSLLKQSNDKSIVNRYIGR